MPTDADAPAPADAPSGRPLGRPRLFPAWHRLWLRVASPEFDDLKAIATAEGKTVTDVVREAVNEYVGDFRERRVFATRERHQVAAARRAAKRKQQASGGCGPSPCEPPGHATP